MGDFTTAEDTSIIAARLSNYAYAGLLTTITSAKAGTVVEASDTNYARQAVMWGTPSAGAVASSAALTWPAAVAGYTVVGVALYAAGSGGSPLVVKAVTSQAVATGNQFSLPSGALTLTVD